MPDDESGVTEEAAGQPHAPSRHSAMFLTVRVRLGKEGEWKSCKVR